MKRSEIYLAAGCFWGAQKYLDMLDGVLETCTGFANGNTENPTYEEVYTDTTGYAETVKVVYDADVLTLQQLVRLYFGSIDPFSVNKQGHDEGTRYRTGVYYSDSADCAPLEKLFAELASEKAGEGLMAVELEPLKSFFPASEYHQKYLEKNPGGYCHLPLSLYEAISEEYGAKKRRYALIQKQLEALLEGETSLVARMAEVAAVLHSGCGFWWTGFYVVEGRQLVLGPFQGPVACLRIPFGRGVCGTAWKEAATQVVPDVEAFPGHIACSSASRSEIVVPVFGSLAAKGRRPEAVMAVLDIDSASLATFDSTDALCLERLVESLFVDGFGSASSF